MNKPLVLNPENDRIPIQASIHMKPEVSISSSYISGSASAGRACVFCTAK